MGLINCILVLYRAFVQSSYVISTGRNSVKARRQLPIDKYMLNIDDFPSPGSGGGVVEFSPSYSVHGFDSGKSRLSAWNEETSEINLKIDLVLRPILGNEKGTKTEQVVYPCGKNHGSAVR